MSLTPLRSFLFYVGEEQDIELKERLIIEIITNRSFPQIKAAFEMYKIILKKDITETINKMYTSDFQYALKTLGI